MTLHIACDVCRRPYQIDEARLGSTLTCKECSVPFAVCHENVIDPDAPPADAESGEPPPSEWAQVWACTVNGVGAVGVILSLVGMAMLLFHDPRAATGRAASIVSPSAQPDRPGAPLRLQGRPRLTPAMAAAIGQAAPANRDAFTPPLPDTAALRGFVPQAVAASDDPFSPGEGPGSSLPLALTSIDPLQVRPERTFRVLGTGLSGVERVVLVPLEAPAVAAGSHAGFTAVSDGELQVQIGSRPGPYVLVLERNDATLVTVPADAVVVTSAVELARADAQRFVVVRPGGRLSADSLSCCLVEAGGELNCPSASNWAGWFASGSIATGRILPPSVWITPETAVQVAAPVRSTSVVATPQIIAAEVAALVVADPSAPETPGLVGEPHED